MRNSTQFGIINIDIEPSGVFEYFISSCRKNIHVFLCLNLTVSNFRTKLRMFPSIVKNCIIDWFEVNIFDLIQCIIVVIIMSTSNDILILQSSWELNVNGKRLQTAVSEY